ncbi:MAG: hypothetical protein ABI625_16065, partial [bacterium]
MTSRMLRLQFSAACLAGVALTATARAQVPTASSLSTANTPAPMPLSAIPKTLAGDALRAWFDAFNSGDSTRIALFLRTYGSDLPVDAQLGFRRRTGGFDLLSIERSEPRHIEFFVRERGGITTAVGELDLPTTGTPRIVGPALQPLGPNVPLASTRIDAATRARVIDAAAAVLDS